MSKLNAIILVAAAASSRDDFSPDEIDEVTDLVRLT
jgi:hypothetical protein